MINQKPSTITESIDQNVCRYNTQSVHDDTVPAQCTVTKLNKKPSHTRILFPSKITLKPLHLHKPNLNNKPQTSSLEPANYRMCEDKPSKRRGA